LAFQHEDVYEDVELGVYVSSFSWRVTGLGAESGLKTVILSKPGQLLKGSLEFSRVVGFLDWFLSLTL